MRTIKLAAGCLAAATLLAAAPAAVAQSYPSKPVRVIIPWPTGGLTDIAGRLVFAKVAEQTGQQFIIDNRPGATGTIGAEAVARAAPESATPIPIPSWATTPSAISLRWVSSSHRPACSPSTPRCR